MKPKSAPRFTSVATRLMLGVAAITVLCFGVTAVIIYASSSKMLLDSAKSGMNDVAQLEAQRISTDLGAAFNANESFANSLLVQRRQGTAKREIFSEVLRSELRTHPDWTGHGTMWEPQAFDGNDAGYANAEGHDATGRYMSYWAWQGNTEVREPLRDYELPGSGDWYLKPRN